MKVALRRVTKRFGAVRALAGVDTTFVAGRVAVVSGANGSGKSTLLSILGTLVRPTSGVVDLSEVGSDVRGVRARLGWLGHDTFLYGDLSGRENLELAARVHGLRPADVLESGMHRFALGAFIDRLVRTYSRGQRQRLALARTLLHRPGLLLLDEPTSGLDAASCALVAGAVRAEAEAGAVVVVITHDASLGAALDGDAWRLEGGRVVGRPASPPDERGPGPTAAP
jgi:heme exporter protein A